MNEYLCEESTLVPLPYLPLTRSNSPDLFLLPSTDNMRQISSPILMSEWLPTYQTSADQLLSPLHLPQPSSNDAGLLNLNLNMSPTTNFDAHEHQRHTSLPSTNQVHHQPQMEFTQQMNYITQCDQSYRENQQFQFTQPHHAASMLSLIDDTTSTSSGCVDNQNLSQLISSMKYMDVIKHDNNQLQVDQRRQPTLSIPNNRALTIYYRYITQSVSSHFTMNTVLGLQQPLTSNGCSESALNRLLFNFAGSIASLRSSDASCPIQNLDIQFILNSSLPIELECSFSPKNHLPTNIYEYNNTSWELFIINVILFRSNLGRPLAIETGWLYQDVFYIMREMCTNTLSNNLPPVAGFINPTIRGSYLYFGAVLESYISYMTNDMLCSVFEFLIADEDN